jgi:molybdopterin-guanine dinucleotide biosynthesis protein A
MSSSANAPEYDAVVLAGGAARRLGGTDKAALEIHGVRLLDRVLAACADASSIVVVGPPRTTKRPVLWTREQPPGSGPVAAVAAAMPLLSAPIVVLLAADLPFVDRACVHRLVDAVGEADGAVLVDAAGRDQLLLAAYRTQPLARRLTECGALRGLPLHRLIAGLNLNRLPDSARAAFDCDTWADVAAARSRSGKDGHRAG